MPAEIFYWACGVGAAVGGYFIGRLRRIDETRAPTPGTSVKKHPYRDAASTMLEELSSKPTCCEKLWPYREGDKETTAIVCPMCGMVVRNTESCDCDDYDDVHLHQNCRGCGAYFAMEPWHAFDERRRKAEAEKKDTDNPFKAATKHD